MHCSADLTDELAAADTDDDGTWDQANAGTDISRGPTAGTGNERLSTDAEEDDQLLDPDGLADNTLTVVVGILGGLVVGIVGTIVLLIVSGSGWAVGFGLAAWLGATAYLVRRRTVQGAVAKSGYAVSLVLLLVPVIALSPVLDVTGGLEERGGLFVVLLIFVGVPAAIAAVIGWIASRFVPAAAGGDDG